MDLGGTKEGARKKYIPRGDTKFDEKKNLQGFLFKERIKSTKKDDLGSYVLNILKLPRNSRSNNGKDNDLVTEIAMQECITVWQKEGMVLKTKLTQQQE